MKKENHENLQWKTKNMRFSACHYAFWIMFYACTDCDKNVIYWAKTLHKKEKS